MNKQMQRIVDRMKGPMNKRGLFNQTGMIIGFVVLVITAAIVALVVANIQTSFATGTAQYNTTSNGLLAFSNYAALLPVVGTVLVAVLILSLVIGGLAVFGNRN